MKANIQPNIVIIAKTLHLHIDLTEIKSTEDLENKEKKMIP
jgi:hypothetical protein